MTLARTSLDALRATVEGQVLVPTDTDYDAARRIFNGMIDRRPLAIVRPTNAADVGRALAWAAAEGVPVAVRGGGHGVAGHAVADDALLIDLSQRRGVEVDSGARRATAEGGCQLLDIDTATQAYGLAVPGGTFGDTGIAGLTLGGGLGYLMGSYGLTCDNLVGAELVTADGTVRWVDEASDPELLWALRGGGGNFGVVTRFQYVAHPVQQLFGGPIYYPIARAADVLRLVRDVQAEAPDELVCIVYLGSRQGFDGPVVEVVTAFNGPISDGEAATRRLRESEPILADRIRRLSYLDLQATNRIIPFGLRHYWKGHFVREFSDEVTDAIATAMGRHKGPVGGVLVELLHGEARRVPEASAAFGQRAATANVSGIGAWFEPVDDARQISWAREFADALLPHSLTGAGYLNYAAPDEPASRVRDAFGAERFDRLVAIKRRCDPDNRFRFNVNIPLA